MSSEGRWVSVSDAAAILDVPTARIYHWTRTSTLRTESHDGRRVVDLEQAQAILEDDTRWITVRSAAELTGLSPDVLAHAARHGQIEQRPLPRKGRPSLLRTAVLEFANSRRTADALRREQQRRREVERLQLHGWPDDEHTWLRVEEAADALGRSPSGVRKMISEERLPATRVGRRWWLRQDHVGRIAAAQEFVRNASSQEPARPLHRKDPRIMTKFQRPVRSQ